MNPAELEKAIALWYALMENDDRMDHFTEEEIDALDLVLDAADRYQGVMM